MPAFIPPALRALVQSSPHLARFIPGMGAAGELLDKSPEEIQQLVDFLSGPQSAEDILMQAAKPRSTEQEQKEADKAQGMPPKTGSRTPQTTKDLQKLKENLNQKSVINGISQTDDSGFVDATPWSTTTTAQDFLPSNTESLPQDFDTSPYIYPADELSDSSYSNPFPTDVPDTSVMNIIKEKGGNWGDMDLRTGQHISLNEALDQFRFSPYTYDEWMPDDRAEETAPYPLTVEEELVNERNRLDKIKQRQLDGPLDWTTDIEDAEQRISTLEVQSEWNNWIDTKLQKYIVNEMGTMDDPVRKGIKEHGVTHYSDIDDTFQQQSQSALDWESDLNFVQQERKKGGYSPDGVENLHEDYDAFAWEFIADSMIKSDPKDKYMGARYGEGDPAPAWMEKLPSDARFYNVGNGTDFNLGALELGHVRDEIQNAMDPDSGLPPDLLIPSGKLGKMGVPEVFTHIGNINTWRSQNIAKADHAKAFNAATHPMEGFSYNSIDIPESDKVNYKYDKGGPNVTKDLQWVELRDPTDRDFQSRTDLLDISLKYEGDHMAHCTGSYCQKVRFGDRGIYSLRDSDGLPRVTIEVLKKEVSENEMNEVFQEAYERGELINNPDNPDNLGSMVKAEREYLDQWKKTHNPMKITQVKGWNNKKIFDVYKPMVKDFVEKNNAIFVSHPDGYDNYGRGDIEATGLIEIANLSPQNIRQYIDAGDKGGITPIATAVHQDLQHYSDKYTTQEELFDLIDKYQNAD
jgi:hypothetical protein